MLYGISLLNIDKLKLELVKSNIFAIIYFGSLCYYGGGE